MTSLQLAVLGRATYGTGIPFGLKGTSLTFEYQAGRVRQVKRLLSMGLVRQVYGRIVATRSGLKIYKYHRPGYGI